MGDQANPLILPIDIIFSCSVCHATVSEVYKNEELDQGFRDGSNGAAQQPVTKLWLTQCSHVTCSKHLEGGGVPFHRAGEQPRAPCPICVVENDNADTRELYGIRGFSKGQYDPKIPSEWFESPPIELGGKGKNKGMEAMTFHYLALARFGIDIFKELRKAQAMAERAENNANEESATREKMGREMEMLQYRLKQLEQCEKELKPWKDREPKIKFYLDLFPKITKENERLREQLSAMGYAVPNRSYSIRPDVDVDKSQTPQPINPSNDHLQNELSQNRDELNDDRHQDRREAGPAMDSTFSRPIEPVADLHSMSAAPRHSSRKRSREENENDRFDEGRDRDLRVRGKSRELMPPPPLPLNKTSQPPAVAVIDDNRAAQNHPSAPESVSSIDPQLYPHKRLRLDYDERRDSSPVRRTAYSPRLVANGYSYIRPQQFQYEEYSQSPGMTPRHHPAKFLERENVNSPFNVEQLTQASYGHEHHLQQPLQQLSYGISKEYANRPPLQEQDQSTINSQQYRYAPSATTGNIHAQLTHANVTSQNRRQSLPLNYYQEPITPSPFKYSNPPNFDTGKPDSVISPFFNRQSGMQYSGRMKMAARSDPKKMRSPQRVSSPLQQQMFQTPRRLSRTGIATPARPIYPQSTPARHQVQPQPPRQRLLTSNTPNTPRMTNGLFRRADMLPHSESRLPASPYFRSQTNSQMSHAVLPISTPRPAPLTHRIPTLGSTVPSIGSNIYIPPTQISPDRHAAFGQNSGLPRREFTNHDLGYDHHQLNRSDSRYNHVLTGTGLKSGVSRPSNEFARDASASSAVFGAGRRSVRR